MVDVIKTMSVVKDFAKTNAVLLEQTADTALVFFPEIHPGGVRGDLIRFKKNRNDKWEKIPELDFRKLKLYEGTHIELGTQQLQKLLEEVDKRRVIIDEGVQSGHREYVLNEKENILEIDDDNVKKILNQLLQKGYSEDFWNLLNSANPCLADKLSAGHLQLQRKEVVDNLRARLTGKYYETKGEDSWQRWIYEHSWLFGANYQKPLEKQKINLTGIMPDYLFPTVDGFIDILEIKLPTFEVIEEDRSHPGSWVWSNSSNYAIGQIV
jgi:hypothetical protein